MILFFQAYNGVRGNGDKAFQCAACGGLITHADSLLSILGKRRHFFVNPAGIECDFHTFYACPGALVYGESTEEHSWFPGYGWCMAFCGYCHQHLGWYYESVSGNQRPVEFWGILVDRVTTIPRHKPNEDGDRIH